ncbi:MAG: prepilin-type N-terminal cleavage/methylation domain-containing protein [Armatimonadota bacterium]|nr:prepilin-type N-terminal cleavage/methylation domain-containing protein [bacterium]
MSRIRSGFTLIELLVVIAIIAILAAVLFPVFISAKAKAVQCTCASNLKQMGLAMGMYLTDSNGRYPPWHVTQNSGWFDAVQKYSKSKLLTRCPADQDVWSTSTNDAQNSRIGDYWKNSYLDLWSGGYSNLVPPMESKVRCRTSTVFLMDGPPGGYSGNTYWGPPSSWIIENRRDYKLCQKAERRHSDAANVLFCDWHVRLVKPAEFKSDLSNTAVGNWLMVPGIQSYLWPTGKWQNRNDGIHPWFRPD